MNTLFRKFALMVFLIQCSMLTMAQDQAKMAINKMLDNWHHAAAVADEDVFFGSMTENGIYIGTDKTERWKRDELKEWSKKYFESESAWDFKPFDRDIHVYKEDIAWFSESLNTWMGVCRGSGILRKDKIGWKIEQYHLSVTVDNNKIEDFLKIKPN